MARALFLDRDGTINVDKAYVHRIEDFEFIDGVFDFCRRAQEKGYLLVVITNQSGIARGYYSEEDYRRLTDWMVAEFAKRGVVIADVLHCPELSGPDRKPEPGLFLKARDRHGIDMAASVSLGDKPRDVEAGERAGVGRNILFTGSYSGLEI
jgi:D,D-heptose 1,7-bisphosphate phosphatase